MITSQIASIFQMGLTAESECLERHLCIQNTAYTVHKIPAKF